jgi:hypothetical protein
MLPNVSLTGNFQTGAFATTQCLACNKPHPKVQRHVLSARYSHDTRRGLCSRQIIIIQCRIPLAQPPERECCSPQQLHSAYVDFYPFG